MRVRRTSNNGGPPGNGCHYEFRVSSLEFPATSHGPAAMATFRRFEQIEAWQKARELTNDIYSVTKRGLFSKDFELRAQIRSASVSIMSNIAEGFERNGTAEFVQFLAIAKDPLPKLPPNYMWRLISNTLIQKNSIV
jgi:23S rRNA-intervening sequence protein